ncbi:MAG: helicase, partial [Candidatus Sericytochromatia bacterium]
EGISKKDISNKLKSNNISLNVYGDTLFSCPKFSTSEKKSSINTIELTLLDLGFTKKPISSDIFEKAKSLGLDLCELEIAPYLRLQYPDLPLGKMITIASKKINDDENFPNGFYIINREDGLWLRGYRASFDYEWDLNNSFIFISKI